MIDTLSTPSVPSAVRSRAAAWSARLLEHEVAFCASLCALWFAATAWLRPLAIPDEGRYVGVAWEMLRSGDWLVPTRNGAPFFHKPPLFYWLTAASMRCFGPGLLSARGASLLATTVCAAAIFWFLRRWVGPRPARTTLLVLATTPLFYGSSQYANLDPLVAACISVAILLFAHAALAEEAGSTCRRALAGAFVAAACGVLAKGLIGIVLPAGVLLGWGLARGQLAQVIRLMAWGPGWVLLLGLGAPWFVLMQLRFAGFGHYFFVVQHVQRFLSNDFNNPQPFWFYPALLAATTAPWCLGLLPALRTRFRRQPDAADVRSLMLVWAAGVTAFFSLPSSKPIGYILPVLPPLAVLVALALEASATEPSKGLARFTTRWGGNLATGTAALAGTLCVTIVGIEHFTQPKSQAEVSAHLRAERRTGEPVVFVGNDYVDVPFLARLESPVFVLDAWSPAEVAKDSWRRELVDAERFGRPGRRRRLLHPDELAQALRGQGSAWVVGPWPGANALAWPGTQALVFHKGDTGLWHLLPPPPGSAPDRMASP